jgi:hypothetical protein
MRSDLDPNSLETIEISIPDNIVRKNSTRDQIHYESLPIACDLAVVSLEYAVTQLDPQGVSCDLWVSSALATPEQWPGVDERKSIAERVLEYLGEDYIVNRIRVATALRTHEWFIECGDGRCVGSAPPE